MNVSGRLRSIIHQLVSPAKPQEDLANLQAEQVRLTEQNRELEARIQQHEYTEQALRAEQERLKRITSVTSDYLYSVNINPDGTAGRLELSGAVEAITGYTPEEFVTVAGGWRGVLHPDDLEQDSRDMQTLATNQGTNSVLRIITKSGDIRWVRSNATPRWDAVHNRLIGIYGGTTDVTESILHERTLRESEQRFKTLVANSSDVVTVLDERGKVIFASDSIAPILGYDPRAIVGHTVAAYLHPDDIGRVNRFYVEHVSNPGAQGTLDYRLHHADGSWRYVESRSNNLLNDPIVKGIVINSRDITERVLAEQAMRESENRLRALLDATIDVAFLISTDGTFLTVNKALADLMGSTVEALVGQDGFQIMQAHQQVARKPRFDEVLHTGEPVRFEDAVGEGWADNSIYPVKSPSGEVIAFAVYSRDISEEKRLSEQLDRYTAQLETMVVERTDELRRAKSRIDLILDNTSDAIALAHPNGDVQIANPAFQLAFSAPVSHAIEHFLHLLVNEEQVETVSAALLNTIESGERHRVEVQIADGENKRDIDLVMIPVQMDETDSRWGVLVSARDITKSKEFERFKTRFVTDALHDLATPITGLSTRLYLLKRTPERLSEHTSALEDQVDHLKHLLEDLRVLSHFSREQTTLHLELNDLNKLVERVYKTYEPVAVNKQQTLRLSVDKDAPLVLLDTRLIERVLVNLVSNAINYTEAGKAIHIRTVYTPNWVEISIQDEGVGISEDDLPHIFDRFYRASQAREMLVQGTGLGLAIVKEVVERHRGRVQVQSQIGIGSTFTCYLPMLDDISQITDF